MQQDATTPDPVLIALRAVELARDLRAVAKAGSALLSGADRALAIELADALGTPRLFTTDTCDRIGTMRDLLDQIVASETTIEADVYDGYDEDGRETTKIHEYEVLSEAAIPLKKLAEKLRSLAPLLQRSLDMFAAERLVAEVRVIGDKSPEPAVRTARAKSGR